MASDLRNPPKPLVLVKGDDALRRLGGAMKCSTLRIAACVLVSAVVLPWTAAPADGCTVVTTAGLSAVQCIDRKLSRGILGGRDTRSATRGSSVLMTRGPPAGPAL